MQESPSISNNKPVDISIIVPFYNEEENVLPLYESIKDVMEETHKSFEMIFVDDGSADGTFHVLSDIAERDSLVRIISFRRNFGQTAAMAAGIDHSSGDIIIPLDGDLQNDPGDIPWLLEKLEEGYDVVSGWRKDRKDSPISRNLPSLVANKIISLISGVHLHDYGCSLKAYRRDVIQEVRLYGEMHRFIPIYAVWHGAKVAEIEVRHRPRRHGRSKYGIERTFKVILDLIVVKFLGQYVQKPIYVFGGLGILCVLGGFLTGFWAAYLKYARNTSFIQTPLPQLCVLLFVLGFNAILLGLLAEISTRIYYETQHKKTYLIREKRNFDSEK
ncbi:glycosyltransferase family 2 protein [Candidatus Sumerlaeota bacterium]|nr:glycosyltransferase family 2 protein [Candidatus Sumerlaeota bacterium]